jgi:hypothetical protein
VLEPTDVHERYGGVVDTGVARGVFERGVL